MHRWQGLTLVLMLGIVLLSGCVVSTALMRENNEAIATDPPGEPSDWHLMDPDDGGVDRAPQPFQGTGLVAFVPIADGYRLSLQGALRPYIRVEEGLLVVDLPGALLAESIALPPGVTARRVEPETVNDPLAGTNALNATIPTRMPAGGVRLTLPLPDGPYAFYQRDRETLDLVIHPPGLVGKRIVIDPGHGADETGAVGPGGYPEKAFNLAVARLLQPMLQSAGAEVTLTRIEDTRAAADFAAASPFTNSSPLRADLTERANISNRAQADLFLSIHANGGSPGLRGTETFWTLHNLNASRGLTLAQLIQDEMLRTYGFPDRGIKQRRFNVIRNAQAPAVLIEPSFLTDPQEAALLMSQAGQEQTAQALLRAIERFFGG